MFYQHVLLETCVPKTEITVHARTPPQIIFTVTAFIMSISSKTLLVQKKSCENLRVYFVKLEKSVYILYTDSFGTTNLYF